MTIGEMLGGRLRLRVPGYQRPYAWTVRQAAQLLDDVLLAIDDCPAEAIGDKAGNDYFLGAIVLMETERSSGSGRAGAPDATHEIIDGLQRLATVTILLAVLRDMAEDDDIDAAVAAARCLSDPDSPAHGGDDVRDFLRLRLAGGTHRFFYEYIQQPGASSAMPADDDLPAPETRLLEVREHLMASLIGESRERRRQLLQFLLENCHFAVISARTLDRAHHLFAVLNDRGLPLARGDILKAQILGDVPADRRGRLNDRWRDFEHALGGSFEELFSHLRTIEGRSRARILDEIRMLVDRNGNAEKFVEGTLFPYADILSSIRQASGTAMPPSLSVPLRYLGWLGNHDWVPPLMLYWRAVDGDPGRLVPFLARLERLAYGLRLLGTGSDKRATRYRAVLDAIRTARLDGDAAGPLELTRDEQRLIAFNLRTLHARSQLACKLVLLRLNDLLAGHPQGLDPEDFTVEHVLPQKPGRSSQWYEWFPKADERERCTQSIGNLILVSRDENKQARNSDFASKLKIYFGPDAARQPLITRDIEPAAEWRPEDIKRREDRLTAILNAHWRLNPTRGHASSDKAGLGLDPNFGAPSPPAQAAE
ncbi:MAG: DUF262 domain-containing protein [Hyphomicrobiaceae bacterium]